MSEWRLMTFGEIVTLSNGANFSKKDFGSGLKIIGVKDFADRIVPDWRSVEEVRPSALGSERNLLRAGDLVFVRSNGNPSLVGRCMLVTAGPNSTHSAFTIRARPDPSVVRSRFLAYQMRHWHLVGKMSASNGTNITNLNQGILNSLAVAIPSLATQDRVVEVLGVFDDQIENNSRRIEILEEMAQAIYREWFVEFRYPGHEDVPLVDSELGPIPEGWEVRSASEALDISPSTRIAKDSLNPFVPMTSVSGSHMHVHPVELKVGNSGAKFRNGDTLFARITPCLENGKTAYVQFLGHDQVGFGSTELIVLRGKEVGPEYTYLLARSEDFRGNAIASMSGATGRQRVRNECFDTFFLAVPPSSIVDSFSQCVRPMFELSNELFKANAVLRETRDLLLPKLISGEIDVSELDIELAGSTL